MTPAFVAIDWGTSSFRAWALGRDASILGVRSAKAGMVTLKPAEYEVVLESHLTALGVDNRVPVLICGMAGAAQGWQQAPYLDAPADLSALASDAISVSGISRDVRILPGVAQRMDGAWDVMRGEETILLGVSLNSRNPMSVCLPGTHSKWASLRNGRLERFDTAMTGEIYALLSERSTLSHALAGVPAVLGAEFDAAVREAIAAPERILQKLFSIRAKPLLTGTTKSAQGADRLSGLLIGLEIAGAQRSGGDMITLIASGVLQQTYARAFDMADMRFTTLNANDLVQAGLFHAAQSIWPERFDGGQI